MGGGGPGEGAAAGEAGGSWVLWLPPIEEWGGIGAAYGIVCYQK